MSQKGYKMLDIESQTLFVSRDVIFYEQEFPFQSSYLGQADDPEIVFSYLNIGDCELTPCVILRNEMNDTELPQHQNLISEASNNKSENEVTMFSGDTSQVTPSDVVNIRKSHRPTKAPIWHADYILTKNSKAGQCLYPIQDVVDYCSIAPSYKSFINKFSQEREPTSYQEAVHDLRWVESMRHEIKALEHNHTWDITKHPKDKKAIECKWVYKIIYKADGDIDIFKARLVAKGYNPKEVVDYQVTFSPVVKIVTVRIVIALAGTKQWKIHQMDVFNVFLQGDLNEEVYMKLPLGFKHQSEQGVSVQAHKVTLWT